MPVGLRLPIHVHVHVPFDLRSSGLFLFLRSLFLVFSSTHLRPLLPFFAATPRHAREHKNMPYVRSRKFCCCLPVRFGVFCEIILGIAVGGFFSVAAWLQINKFSEYRVLLLTSPTRAVLPGQ